VSSTNREQKNWKRNMKNWKKMKQTKIDFFEKLVGWLV
jgi:hypothetical protein